MGNMQLVSEIDIELERTLKISRVGLDLSLTIKPLTNSTDLTKFMDLPDGSDMCGLRGFHSFHHVWFGNLFTVQTKGQS